MTDQTGGQFPMNGLDAYMMTATMDNQMDETLLDNLAVLDDPKLLSLTPQHDFQFNLNSLAPFAPSTTDQCQFPVYTGAHTFDPIAPVSDPTGRDAHSSNRPKSVTSTSSSINDPLQHPFDRSPADEADAADDLSGNLPGDFLDMDDEDLLADLEKDQSGPKKAGRKPLTSEPTTKRKAQNRAAQRAFRERKEKHLRDLESRVAELQQSSDSAHQENDRLRAQVDRLQVELREYRKRLSLSSSLVPISGLSSSLYHTSPSGSDGQKKISIPLTKVGSLNSRKLPASNRLLLDRLAKATAVSLSPSPKPSAKRIDDLLPSHRPITSPNPGLAAVKNPARVFQFNSQAASLPSFATTATTSTITTSRSPSAVPAPDPSGSSHADLGEHHTLQSACEQLDGEVSFCELLNMACGTRRNPIPMAMARSRPSSISIPAAQGPTNATVGSDNLVTDDQTTSPVGVSPATPWAALSPGIPGRPFSPSSPDDVAASHILFGDNSFAPSTFSHPADSPARRPVIDRFRPAKRPQVEEEDEVVPGEDTSNLLNCHTIWNKLKQRNIETQTIDMDGLCTELRAKARCSENGVVVDQRDVDAALERLPKKADASI